MRNHIAIRAARALVVVVALLHVSSLRGNQVTVQELSVSPAEAVTVSVTNFYTGGVLAGVNKLLVGNTPMDGFCIDPFHFSSTSPLLYNVVPLSLAPKAPGTMNAAQATEISKLWAMSYNPTMTAPNAAGLQIAIWEVVGGSQFAISGSDYGASALLQSLTAYTGAGSDLVALTGPGQDYVVQRTNALRTPDQGSTLALLGIGVAALFAASRMQGKLARVAVVQ